MNFVSLEFVVFLALTWLAFVAVPSRFRCTVLLIASYIFYASWSLPFVAVILLTTSADYFASHIIYNSPSPSKRKTAFVCALALNLIILGFFKYFNFFLGASCSLMTLAHIKHARVPSHLDILLPLGISYYTFEAISYLVDTYRGEKPSRSWLEYNFYIMYFPHLISGPIVRFSELNPQYRMLLSLPTLDRVKKGLELMTLGYCFKVIIANNCAVIADPIFSNPSVHTVFDNYLAALAFTTQVYFDFMGYTHIARGASLLFNIELPLNFSHPFNAANISNFWERWQISLTRWIRDYVFIPLGGTRRSLPRVLINLFLVMFICGVWHGAGWRYVTWGAYYGILVVVYFLYKRLRARVLGDKDEDLLNNRIYALASTALTFIAVMLACVIFRATTVEAATAMFAKIGNMEQFWLDAAASWQTHQLTGLAIFCILLCCCFLGPWAERLYTRTSHSLPFFCRAQLVTACAVCCYLLACSGTTPFIYFEF